MTGLDLTACDGFRNVSDMTEGYEATETSSISPDGQSYDAHYLVGNYYEWGAVTAGSGVLTDEINIGNTAANTDVSKLVDAKSSICPKGWRLPTGGRYTNGGNLRPYVRDDSIVSLLMAYGYPDTSLSTPIVGEGRIRFDYAPIYFVRGGYIDSTTGKLEYAGGNGYLSTSTASPDSSQIMGDVGFSGSDVFLAGQGSRYTGMSARCLAK